MIGGEDISYLMHSISHRKLKLDGLQELAPVAETLHLLALNGTKGERLAPMTSSGPHSRWLTLPLPLP